MCAGGKEVLVLTRKRSLSSKGQCSLSLLSFSEADFVVQKLSLRSAVGSKVVNILFSSTNPAKHRRNSFVNNNVENLSLLSLKAALQI